MLLYKQINRRIPSILILVFLFLSLQSFAPHYANSQCYNKNTAFKSGEKLSYNVYYNLGFIKIKLADVVLWVEESVYNNKEVYILKNSTQTLSEYEWIIKVKDYYSSYLDKKTMQVERHIQKTLVDKYSTNYDYRFNHSLNKLYVSFENSNTRKCLDTMDLKPCIHDLLSAAYYPRNIDYTNLSVDSKIALPVILDSTIHQIYYKYQGVEIIDSKTKKNISCIKIVPLLVKTSIFTAGEKMIVWLSNDQNKIPIAMESDLKIGKILVRLNNYEGLRYPLSY